MTVPNKPTSGAVEAMEARPLSPLFIWRRTLEEEQCKERCARSRSSARESSGAEERDSRDLEGKNPAQSHRMNSVPLRKATRRDMMVGHRGRGISAHE